MKISGLAKPVESFVQVQRKMQKIYFGSIWDYSELEKYEEKKCNKTQTL